VSLPIFSFQPNWVTAPELTLRALTDLDIAPSGREERTARLFIPALKQKVKVDTQFDQANSKAVVRFMLNNIGQQLIVPLWSEAVPVTAALSSGATAIPCASTSGRLFSDQRSCLLWNGSAAGAPVCELVVPISGGVTTNQVTATTGIVSAYALGSYIVPVMITEPMTEKQTKNWISGFQLDSDATFVEAVDQAKPFPFNVTLPSVRGLPIFPFRFNRTESFEFTSSAQNVVETDDVGQTAAVVTETRPRESIKGTTLLCSRNDVATLMAWFAQTLGRGTAVWVPSDQPDLFFVSQNVGLTTLTAVTVGYAANDFANTARRMILVRDQSNAWHARLVTAAVSNGDGTETLTLESALPALTNFALISQLYLMRSELDELKLTFDAQLVASCDLQFTELPTEIDALLYSDAPADTTPIVAPADGSVTNGVLTT